ncbi:hypothetical protein [uncultured Ruminococcus sp.]|uniref:hypothetical protein n=1 Tax=uncultured Ruminococcus sp. TaxID=165186 RepID=UPI0025EDC5A9|nr:hypothetical protein [uncultured Ruminococcus sp.]
MKVHNTWKRLAAGLLAITLVGGAVPANIGAFDFLGSTAVVASAESNYTIVKQTSLESLKDDYSHNFHPVSMDVAKRWIEDNLDTIGYSVLVLFDYQEDDNSFHFLIPVSVKDGKILYTDFVLVGSIDSVLNELKNAKGTFYYTTGYPYLENTIYKSSKKELDNDISKLTAVPSHIAQAWVDNYGEEVEKESKAAAAQYDTPPEGGSYSLVVYDYNADADRFSATLYDCQSETWVYGKVNKAALEHFLDLGFSVYIARAKKEYIMHGTVTMKDHSYKVLDVDLEGVKLRENIDYYVTYSQKDSMGNVTTFTEPPKEAGSYTAVITGIGDYQGVLTKSFNIVGSGYEGIRIIDGGQGTSTSGHEHLWQIFDGKTNTKWCGRTAGLGAYSNRDSDWLIFEADTPFALHNYVLTTANDTRSYPGRNWKSWRIYGSNDDAAAGYSASFTDHKIDNIDSKVWSLVHQVTDDNVLKPENYTEFPYAVQHNDKEYKYYLLIIDDIVDTSDNVQQMSEIRFNADIPVTLTHVEWIPVTCLKEGRYEYWYDEFNDRYYEDEEGTREITKEETIIPPLGHHVYGEPEWNWDEAEHTATATFTCLACGEKETVEAKVEGSSIGATCTSPGHSSYTATVKFDGRTFTNTKTYSSGEALGHDYGEPVWKWNNAKTSATATFKCTRCLDVQTVKASITSKTTNPTYVKTGKIVYTATAKLNGQTYTNKKTVTIPKLIYNPPTITYEQGDGSVKLQWTEIKGAEKYGIAGYMNGKWEMIDQGEGTSYVLKDLQAGKEYKVCISTKLNGEWFTDPSNAIVVTPKAKAVKDNPKVNYIKGDNAVKLSWNAVDGAEKYAVAGFVNGSWQILAEGNTTSYVLNDLKAGTQYKVAVAAMFNGKWNMDFSNAIIVTPNAAVTSPYPKFKTQVKDGKIGFKWEAVPGAEKYAIAVYQANKWVPVKQLDGSITTWTTPKIAGGTYKAVVVARINGEWVTAQAPSHAATIKVS